MRDLRIRTLEEVISDRLLLLFLINDLRSKGMPIRGTAWQNQLKIIKLSYFSEARMYENKYKALNYNFFKWKDGPFAQELLKDIEHLSNSNLLRFQHMVNVTDETRNLVSNIDDLLFNASEALDIISRINNEHGPLKWDQIQHMVYSTRTPIDKEPMEQVKNGTLILPVLEEQEAEEILQINPEWLDTLEILFDPHMYNSLKKSIALLRSDEGKTLDEVIKSLKLEM